MDALVSELQDLGDLELAMLLSLIAEQHCIITTENDLLQNLATELKLVRLRERFVCHTATLPTLADHCREDCYADFRSFMRIHTMFGVDHFG